MYIGPLFVLCGTNPYPHTSSLPLAAVSTRALYNALVRMSTDPVECKITYEGTRGDLGSAHDVVTYIFLKRSNRFGTFDTLVVVDSFVCHFDLHLLVDGRIISHLTY